MARRNKLAFAAAAAVLTALVLGISISAWQAVRASREAAAARKAETLAQSESQRADLKANEAAIASQTALSRLAQISVKEGWRRVEEGDYLGALQPFAEAWQIEGSNAANAELHHLRLASLLQQCPKLVNVSELTTNFSLAVFSPDRTRFVTAQSIG